MLHEFVLAHREEIIARCRVKVQSRTLPPATPIELQYGIPRFLDQLVDALRDRLSSTHELDRSAAQHGRDLQLQGFTVSQVVHDYGDVCQSITDLALETRAAISVDDFRTLNRCLDDAIASAVSEFGRERDQSILDAESTCEDERFAFFAHEIRNLVNTASVAFEVLKTGNVGVSGSTGSVLKRSLSGLRDLINRSIAEIRLRHGINESVDIVVAEFIEELAQAALLEAAARDLRLVVQPGEAGVAIHGDRPTLAAVIVNLLQNAFKFTRPRTTVVLSVSASADRVLIQVEDECGGFPDANIKDLLGPFEQRHADRTGLGLGLAFSRLAAEANNAHLHARNLPDHGCVFTVDLPRVAADVCEVV